MALIMFDLIRRANSTSYNYGDLVAPAVPNGHVYLCTTPGQSGVATPVFSAVSGGATADGAVVWTECNPSGLAHVALPFIFSRNPRYRGGIRRNREYIQPIDYTEAGDPIVYEKGLSPRDRREISYDDLPVADREALDNFIRTVRGSRYRFRFTDEDEVSHVVILLNSGNLSSAPSEYGLEGDINLQLLLV